MFAHTTLLCLKKKSMYLNRKKEGAVIATAQILEHILNYRHQVIRG